MNDRQPVEALIFDFDGLIVETEMPLFEAWQHTYAAFGHELILEEYVGCVGSDFGGWDPKRNLEQLTGEPIEWDHWDRERNNLAHEIINTKGPMDGVVELLEAAEKAGIPCAVASSSSRRWVEGHLDRIGLLHIMKLTRCRDDVEAPKPSPELFVEAAKGLGVDPKNTIVFEDSLHGLNAAILAGNPCVIVPNPVTTHLEFEGAAARVESMVEVTIEWLETVPRPLPA